MPRRGMKVCLLCVPEGNGTRFYEPWEKERDPEFEQMVNAVGKYFLPRRSGARSGWIPVCEDCAAMVARQGYPVEYFDKRPKPQIGPHISMDGPYNHKMYKVSLVTEKGGYDIWACSKCNGRIHRRLGQDLPKTGCTVA